MNDKNIKPIFSDNDNEEYKKLKNENKPTIFQVFGCFQKTKNCSPKEIISMKYFSWKTSNCN